MMCTIPRDPSTPSAHACSKLSRPTAQTADTGGGPDPGADRHDLGVEPGTRRHSSATVVLPTYNERETVGPVIDELLSLDSVDRILVVDDDSPDGTARHVMTHYPENRVGVIIRPDGDDLSTAVLRGFDEANTELLVCMDADGQHPPEAVPDLVAAVTDGADIAIGSRHTGAGYVDADWPRVRYVMSLGGSLVSWAAVPEARATQDPMSGMFATRAAVVEAVRDRLDPEGHKILLELLAQCPVDRVVEVPIRFAPRDAGASKTDAAEVLRYLRHMGRLAVRARQRPQVRRETRPREVTE